MVLRSAWPALFAAILAPSTVFAETPAPVLTQPPVLEQMVEPVLPSDASYPAPELEIVVELDVTATGTVAAARLLSGVGAPFDQAAVEAGSRLRFSPARLETGEAVPVRVNFRFRMFAPLPPVPPPPPPPEPTTVRIELLEKGTRKPVEYAQVMAREQNVVLAEGVTDAQGRFELLVVSSSTFTLDLLPSGHEAVVEDLSPSPGEVVERRYYVARTGRSYETIVRGQLERREVNKEVIRAETVAKVPGTQGDTLKVIQNLPGVARPSFGGAPLVLRGAAPGDSRFFLEGQEIPSLYHFGGIRSTINSAFLEAVEFVPGNFGPELGRATGGVVDVRLRDPASDTFRGSVDLNLYDAGFALEGPISDELSLGAAFHRSWVDLFLPLVIPEDSNLAFDTAPRFYDYQFLATWRPSPTHKLRAIYYGSLDRLEALFDDPAGDPSVRGALSTRVMFHKLYLSSEAEISTRLKQTTSIQTGYQELSFALGQDFFFDLDVYRVSLRSIWDYEASDTVSVRVGTDSRIQFVNIGLTSPTPPKEGETPVPISTVDTVSVDQAATLTEPSLFLSLSFRPTEALRLLPSVRADYYSAIGKITVDPRMLAELRVYETTTLRAGLGLYQQPPQPDESDETTGSADLGAELSVQASLGVEQTLPYGLTLGLTGFYKWLDELVVRNPRLATNPSAPLYTNEGTGRILGLEALLKFQLEDVLYGWVAYTFQRSFRTDAPGGQERVFDFDQPHILTALATWEIGAGWSLGARWRLVSGNPYAPVTGSIYDAYTDVYVPVFARERSRLPAFHQLDVRLDKTWTFDTWKLGLYLDVQNAYNRQNPEGVSYSYDYSESQLLSGLPILPILGVRGDW